MACLYWTFIKGMKKGSIALGAKKSTVSLRVSFLAREATSRDSRRVVCLIRGLPIFFLHPRFRTFFRLISYPRCVESPKVDFLKYLLLFREKKRKRGQRKISVRSRYYRTCDMVRYTSNRRKSCWNVSWYSKGKEKGYVRNENYFPLYYWKVTWTNNGRSSKFFL